LLRYRRGENQGGFSGGRPAPRCRFQGFHQPALGPAGNDREEGGRAYKKEGIYSARPWEERKGGGSQAGSLWEEGEGNLHGQGGRKPCPHKLQLLIRRNGKPKLEKGKQRYSKRKKHETLSKTRWVNGKTESTTPSKLCT